ncbi:MAG TPA: hypothetical protein VNX88_25185 [Terriglobales bacterium]|jgi:hypothetical protein|nr:hypothetical protein [Terriglobales bacterium]
MTNKKTTEIVAEIVELLTPIESPERLRVIQASLTLLGEAFPPGSFKVVEDRAVLTDTEEAHSTLPARAQAWMKQNSVSLDELQQVFHFENGTADVIAGDVPGKSKKEKTYNAYVLAGLASLLSIGNPNFDDKSGRALCERLGCYDAPNHSTHMKEKGNEFTGSKDKGWGLTAPGLKRAAALVKEMTKS